MLSRYPPRASIDSEGQARHKGSRHSREFYKMTSSSAVEAAKSRPTGHALDLIVEWLQPLSGATILDVGCGGGRLAEALSAKGAEVTGIDPQEAALAAARSRAPTSRFECASAELMPFADASFDAVVFLNSLHHIPGGATNAALREAMRVSKGKVLIIEPLAEGSFFAAMQPIEDESPIRAAAQAAIRDAEAEGVFKILRCEEFEDARSFVDCDAFLAMVVAVDPARVAIATREKARVAALIAKLGVPGADGVSLTQPHRAHLVARILA